jgi:hypothetical protein
MAENNPNNHTPNAYAALTTLVDLALAARSNHAPHGHPRFATSQYREGLLLGAATIVWGNLKVPGVKALITDYVDEGDHDALIAGLTRLRDPATENKERR